MSDYNVGYKKPPNHSKFVKGKSGNPNGRPKNLALSTLDLLKKELEQEITVKENGKFIKMTMQQAAMRTFVHKATKGDMAAFKFLIHMCNGAETLEKLIETPFMIIQPPDGPMPPMPPIFGED